MQVNEASAKESFLALIAAFHEKGFEETQAGNHRGRIYFYLDDYDLIAWHDSERIRGKLIRWKNTEHCFVIIINVKGKGFYSYPL